MARLSYRLVGFAPVLPGAYAFVHPVFISGDKAALQVVEGGRVAAMQSFTMDGSVVPLETLESVKVTIGASPLLAFQPSSTLVWFGGLKALRTRLQRLLRSIECGENVATPIAVDEIQQSIDALRHTANDADLSLDEQPVVSFRCLADGRWVQRVQKVKPTFARRRWRDRRTQLAALRRKLAGLPSLAGEDGAYSDSVENRSISFAVTPFMTELVVARLFGTIGPVESVRFADLRMGSARRGLSVRRPKLLRCTVVMELPLKMGQVRELADSIDSSSRRAIGDSGPHSRWQKLQSGYVLAGTSGYKRFKGHGTR